MFIFHYKCKNQWGSSQCVSSQRISLLSVLFIMYLFVCTVFVFCFNPLQKVVYKSVLQVFLAYA